MDLQTEKCVMVVDEKLPLGMIANTAAIMGIYIDKKVICSKSKLLRYRFYPLQNLRF